MSSATNYRNSTSSSQLFSFPQLVTITTAPSAQTVINGSIDRCQALLNAWRLSSKSFDDRVLSEKAAGKHSTIIEIYTSSWTDTRYPTLWYTRDDGFHRISTLLASATVISSLVVTETRHETPVYQISEPSCSSTCWNTAPRCYVDAMAVELFYWPVAPVSGYSNATVTSNITKIVTATMEGLTITSPTVVLSYGAISATDDCGNTVGGVYSGRLLTLHPDSVSSLYGRGGPDQHGSPFRFNFADLNIPHPLSVQLKQFWPTPIELCVLEDAAPYNPRLADPPEIIGLDPAWKSCGKPQFGTQDPPRILVPAQALVNPTPAADARTKLTAAIPASSFPSPGAVSSTAADLVSSPSNTPEQSTMPFPGDGRPVDIDQPKDSDLEQGPEAKSDQNQPSYQRPSGDDPAIADPSGTNIDPTPINASPTKPSARASPLSKTSPSDPAIPDASTKDLSSVNASPLEPLTRDSTLPTLSLHRSSRQNLPSQSDPTTDLIPSKDQMSSDNSHTTDPSASNKILENTPLGKGPNPPSPSSDPFVKVAAKLYTANNGQDFIVAIGSSATLAPYDGKSVATVLGQVISLQGTNGIVVVGTKTVRLVAFQTTARSDHSGGQAQATTDRGDSGGVSNPARPPATSLQSVHLAQVISAAVGNEIFGLGTDEDQPTSPSVMTIQGEIFHEAGLFVLTRSNPSPAGIIPSATLTGSSQILMETKSTVLTDGSGIPISTLFIVHPPPATTKTITLASPEAGGANKGISSKINLGSHTIFPGISQDIVVQGGKTATLTRSSRMIDGEGRLLPSLLIVLESSSTSAQASLPGPGDSESTKVALANEPTPTIILKKLRLAELIMKGFDVGASTPSGGSTTTLAGVGRNESSVHVNSTDITSDNTIANGVEVEMTGRGGRMRTTRWEVGLAAFSIVVWIWTGI